MSAATVVVVMPTRNQARFIEASVRSVLGQTDEGLRLVVQDGASTDGTPELLARLAAMTPAIDWRSEPDSGPADAIARAFTRALADPAAQLFGWLNSDDLYTPGALDRVRAHFTAHPDHVAVYGEGLHVDVDGHVLGPYPTRGPATPLAEWADGCHVCQPTMWLRREALEALMPLDLSLKAAFDYEWWLRLLTRFPGRVGMIDAVQAHSRLHDEGITLSQRRRVALEAVRVVHRHLGPAPGHWLLTCADELFASEPSGADFGATLDALLADAADHVAPQALDEVRAHWAQHRAFNLARPGVTVAAQADGWMTARTPVRVCTHAPDELLLHLRRQGPVAAPLRLAWIDPAGQVVARLSSAAPTFSWRIALPDTGGVRQSWTLAAEPHFVPALVEPGSTDQRELVCQLDAVTLRSQPVFRS